MTSLSNQLEILRNATARHLTIEKRHVSLLFDQIDAGKLNNEMAFRIGVAGLEQMKRIDSIFDTNDFSDLFSETRIDFVRSLLEKKENEKLDVKLEKLLYQLSPYLQHFACQQVLEFLVHTYQIYAYNAEFLIVNFLPFHSTKIFARLMRILDFDWARSKEFAFIQEYKKNETVIPFTSIAKAAMSGTHSLITKVTDHIKNGVQVVGSDFLEVKHPVLFNFHAKLLLSLFNDPQRVDEMMLSKVMPFIENGLKSNMTSFRYCSLMVICQLVLTVKLKDDVLKTICKLIITKMQPETLSNSLTTLLVVFQQQNINQLQKKVLKKMLNLNQEMQIFLNINKLSKRTDNSKFYNAMWRHLFEFIRESNGINDEDAKLAKNVLLETIEDIDIFNGELAKDLFEIIFAEGVNGLIIDSKKFNNYIHAIAIKFAKQFDEVYEKHLKVEKKQTKKVLAEYGLRDILEFSFEESKEVMEVDVTDKQYDKNHEEDLKISAQQKAEYLANSSEFSKRQVFTGDPIDKAIEWLKEEKWEKLEWAFDELSKKDATYFSKKPVDDVEQFLIDVVRIFGVEKCDHVDKSVLKSGLMNIKVSPQVFAQMLTNYSEIGETSAKRPKTEKISKVKKAFKENETEETFRNRTIFVLEIMNAQNQILSSSALLKSLYSIVKAYNMSGKLETLSRQHYLVLNIIRKILENPGKSRIVPHDIDMDCIIETMREAHNHHIMRDCLRLIVASTKYAPMSVVKHVMSIFTFMGNGMLRKDNELTLSIVENTVESLFSAIIKCSNQSQLIELSKLFAASVVDIPAHRRARIAHGIARAVGARYASTVVLVMISTFCTRWNRTTEAAVQETAKRGSDQEAYDDLSIELLATLSPFDQLAIVLELIKFVLRLGGDEEVADLKKNDLDALIFDRTTHKLPRIRHFRYVIVTFISRVFSTKSLIERMATYDDEQLLINALPLSKQLIECSVELDKFASDQSSKLETTDASAQRYWVAFASRTEVVSEKLRHLLPGSVAARLIAEVLQECAQTVSYRMCEKVLQLANIKIGHDGYLFENAGINEHELIELASALNRFIVAERLEEERIRLCQNAAFTLKLIAKHLPTQTESNVLGDTMNRCVKIVEQYEKLDDNLTGNVLLLAGELIRSHNMRATIPHSLTLLKICLKTVQECIDKLSKSSQFDNTQNQPQTKGQRIRQQSLGGQKFGSDTLLVCSLTCIQRIFDQFSSFVSEYSSDVIVRYCRLIARFGDPLELFNMNLPSSSSSQTGNKSGIQHRLGLIRRALLSIEIRIMPKHFAVAVSQIFNDRKSLCALFHLMTAFVEQPNRRADKLRTEVVEIRSELMENVVLPALEYRGAHRRVDEFDQVEKLEKSVSAFVISMANILSEQELRPIVNEIIVWAEAGLKSDAPINVRLRLVSLMLFSNCLYEAFNSLALPYFSRLIEMAEIVLRKCNSTTSESSLLLGGKRGTIDALEADYVLTQSIDLISNAAKHRDFFTIERCNLVTDTVVDELINTKVEGHERRCCAHLSTAIYRIGNADPENFGDLLSKMMMKTRDNRAKIRYRTLLVLELLIDKIGDNIQPHISIILPFLNELIEDENKQVEVQCQKVINALQQKFGENFWS